MSTRSICVLQALLDCLAIASAHAETPAGPVVPQVPIKLFNGRDLEGLYTFLEDTGYRDERAVFSVHSGVLRISGDGYGGVTTRDSFRDYRQVCEFRWGAMTWNARKERARDSGILVHGDGPDGAFLNRWPSSFEAQIIEGGIGDILVLNADANSQKWTLAAKVVKDRDGEAVWNPTGMLRVFSSGRINWKDRDVDWEDWLGFRGANDIDDANREWTRMEVVCAVRSISVYVNGVLVNQTSEASHDSGRITLQCEGAEMFVRRWELHPLEAD